MAAKKRIDPDTTLIPEGLVVWDPKPFEGNDLLPMELLHEAPSVEGVPEVVGRENVDPDDLVLPALALLQSMSKAVKNRVEDAEPGRFMHTGTEHVLPEGPVRCIIAHYHKGNALFPKDNNPLYDGLKTCISSDGVEGTVYGACEDCRKCLWDKDDWDAPPPLGAETHHFVALTNMGPVMLRFSRSSFKGGSKFLSTWTNSSKNLWTHPAILRTTEESKTLQSGTQTKYFTLQMAWQVTERVPAELQRAAFAVYNTASKKHETGNLKSQDEPDDLFDD